MMSCKIICSYVFDYYDRRYGENCDGSTFFYYCKKSDGVELIASCWLHNSNYYNNKRISREKYLKLMTLK